MNRRAFLALVGASASAGMLPTRKVSPVQAIKPGDMVYLRPGTYSNLAYNNQYMMDPDNRKMGWMVTQEVLNNDLYGVLNG